MNEYTGAMKSKLWRSPHAGLALLTAHRAQLVVMCLRPGHEVTVYPEQAPALCGVGVLSSWRRQPRRFA